MSEQLTGGVPLAATAAKLRSGETGVVEFVNQLCDRIEAVEPQIEAFIPEEGRRERLLRDAAELQKRWPVPAKRPPLYGVPVGVKDLFRADGFETRCGSQLPAECFTGEEAATVTAVKQAGALVLGKTVTTEFAYFQPGPTRNPHNPAHTPGGSSSGSAAAVAAGMTPFAFGTQTIGSVSRPAAFCGVLGFKPSYNRIDPFGVVPFSPSADHIGFFTVDMEGLQLGASLLVRDWRGLPDAAQRMPVLGVPEGPYLEQTGQEALVSFREQLQQLEQAGFVVKPVAALQDIEQINSAHRTMIAADLAEVHREWFAEYENLYSERTADLIRQGTQIDPADAAEAKAGRFMVRQQLMQLMDENSIDLFVMPSAPDGAPQGIAATGDPIMNLPWTYSGLPTVSIPAGKNSKGLPLGLQLAAPFMEDERLLVDCERLITRSSFLNKI